MIAYYVGAFKGGKCVLYNAYPNIESALQFIRDYTQLKMHKKFRLEAIEWSGEGVMPLPKWLRD